MVFTIGVDPEGKLKCKQKIFIGQIDAAELLDLLDPVIDGIPVDKQHLGRPCLIEPRLRIDPQGVEQLHALFGIIPGQQLQRRVAAGVQQSLIVDPVQHHIESIVQIEVKRPRGGLHAV